MLRCSVKAIIIKNIVPVKIALLSVCKRHPGWAHLIVPEIRDPTRVRKKHVPLNSSPTDLLSNLALSPLKAVCEKGLVVTNSSSGSVPNENWISTAATPEGPWSEPVRIDSIFNAAQFWGTAARTLLLLLFVALKIFQQQYVIARAVCYALLSARASWIVIGACTSMLWTHQRCLQGSATPTW